MSKLDKRVSTHTVKKGVYNKNKIPKLHREIWKAQTFIIQIQNNIRNYKVYKKRKGLMNKSR